MFSAILNNVADSASPSYPCWYIERPTASICYKYLDVLSFNVIFTSFIIFYGMP
jgi:hypothetical protein